MWLGRWWGFDPTGAVPTGQRHVVAARGRDHGDVPPLKGIHAGGGSQRLGVVVEVTRLQCAPVQAARPYDGSCP